MGVEFLFLVVFVADVAHHFFQNVLHGYHAECAAKFIDHDGDVNFVFLKFAQQVIDFLGFGHEIGRPYQRLPFEHVVFGQVWQQVFDVEYAAYVVRRILHYGNARVAVFFYCFQHLCERRVAVDGYHVEAHGHHGIDAGAAKVDNAFQNLFLVVEFFAGRQVDGFVQFVYRQVVVALARQVVQRFCGFDQQHGKRPTDFGQHHKCSRGAARGLHGVLLGVHFGHYFAKQQQQKGDDDRLHQKFEPRDKHKRAVYQVGGQHYDGYIYEVVGYQYGSKQIVRLLLQCKHTLVGFGVGCLHLALVLRRQREESHFAARYKRRNAEQHHDDDECDEAVNREWFYANDVEQ